MHQCCGEFSALMWNFNDFPLVGWYWIGGDKHPTPEVQLPCANYNETCVCESSQLNVTLAATRRAWLRAIEQWGTRKCCKRNEKYRLVDDSPQIQAIGPEYVAAFEFDIVRNHSGGFVSTIPLLSKPPPEITSSKCFWQGCLTVRTLRFTKRVR